MIMNKKVALVTLIEASMMLSSEDKLALIDKVPALNNKQVEALGKMLAQERSILLANQDAIMKNISSHLHKIAGENSASDPVYVGTGKPT